MSKFTIQEVLDIAVKVEQKGATFYKEYSENSDRKDIFNLLSEDEVNHYKVFKAIQDSLPKEVSAAPYPGGIALYLKAIAEESIFNEEKQPFAKLKKLNSDIEVLKFALNLEHDMIKLYQLLRKNIPAKYKKIVDAVIIEEKGHAAIFSKLIKDLA